MIHRHSQITVTSSQSGPFSLTSEFWTFLMQCFVLWFPYVFISVSQLLLIAALGLLQVSSHLFTVLFWSLAFLHQFCFLPVLFSWLFAPPFASPDWPPVCINCPIFLLLELKVVVNTPLYSAFTCAWSFFCLSLWRILYSFVLNLSKG